MNETTPKPINVKSAYTARRHPYLVSVFIRHPHFHDTGFDSECIEPARTMWSSSPAQMIEYARQTLIPPHYDPALVSIVVEALDSDIRAEG